MWECCAIRYKKDRQRRPSLLGTPDTIRTYDLLLRKQALYPAELRVHTIACQLTWLTKTNNSTNKGYGQALET